MFTRYQMTPHEDGNEWKKKSGKLATNKSRKNTNLLIVWFIFGFNHGCLQTRVQFESNKLYWHTWLCNRYEWNWRFAHILRSIHVNLLLHGVHRVMCRFVSEANRYAYEVCMMRIPGSLGATTKKYRDGKVVALHNQFLWNTFDRKLTCFFILVVSLEIRSSTQIVVKLQNRRRHCFHVTVFSPLDFRGWVSFLFVYVCAFWPVIVHVPSLKNALNTSTMIKCNYVHHHGIHTTAVLAHKRLQGQRMYIKRDGTDERGSKNPNTDYFPQGDWRNMLRMCVCVWLCGSGHSVHIRMWLWCLHFNTN